ncbi:hypothetical protein BMT54_08370 [Pasteurellaceae bacterium 15-036681]|nr:hypothetical protein BMT54_08370 [Pasteurellaceae bacterium 15-036681]
MHNFALTPKQELVISLNARIEVIEKTGVSEYSKEDLLALLKRTVAFLQAETSAEPVAENPPGQPTQIDAVSSKNFKHSFEALLHAVETANNSVNLTGICTDSDSNSPTSELVAQNSDNETAETMAQLEIAFDVQQTLTEAGTALALQQQDKHQLANKIADFAYIQQIYQQHLEDKVNAVCTLLECDENAGETEEGSEFIAQLARVKKALKAQRSFITLYEMYSNFLRFTFKSDELAQEVSNFSQVQRIYQQYLADECEVLAQLFLEVDND